MKTYGFEDGIKIQKGDFDEWQSTVGFRKTNDCTKVVWKSNHVGKKTSARQYIRGAARQANKKFAKIEFKKFLEE